MEIDKLRSTLESLPTLDERLHTWQFLIKKLDNMERNILCIAETALSENNSIAFYNEKLSEVEEFHNEYRAYFNGLLSRLEIPIKAYSDRISELSGEQFRLKAKEFRITENIRCKAYALELAEKSFTSYRQGSVWDYIKTQESAVNGWHFTPGIMDYKNDLERKISWEEFSGFNPDGYAAEFRVELRRLFKQGGLI